jgi:L-alanine-DL-glutamate epimerase-like enolase superfamily enzyme
MKISSVCVTVVEVPQIWPIAPYRSHIRSSSTTRHALVRLATDEGLIGWGEHNVNFLPGISARQMEAQARDWLIGRDPRQIEAYHQTCPFEFRLRSGVEMALWDICAQAAGAPLAILLGGILRPEVEVAACMGIQSYERAGEIARHYVEQGFGTLKTKAGSDMNEDLEMVRGVRDAVGKKLKLRIDPNRAYTPEKAAELARRLEEYELEYFEQPIPAEPLSTAAWLRRQTKTPIALNESVTDASSALAIIREDAADFILPDLPEAGGIWPCVKIAHVAEAAGMPCIMHCGHDLGPKTAAMVHVAAACRAFSLANDTTYYGLVEDVTTEPLVIRRGKIAVPLKPGLGVTCDQQKLQKYRVEC